MGAVDFLVVTDDPGFAAPLVEATNALTTVSEHHTDVSDLLLLSLVAVWLGDGRYVWPREHLQEEDGWLSLWGDEPAQVDGLTAENRRALVAEGRGSVCGRGIAVGSGEDLPEGFATDVLARRRCVDRRADLVYFGAIPV